MNNPDRKLVMLKPASAVERFVRARFSAIMVLRSAARNSKTKGAMASIIFNGQSWAKKKERIKAEFNLSCESEMFSDRNLRRMGMRKVRCQCGAGVGHNRPRVQDLKFS